MRDEVGEGGHRHGEGTGADRRVRVGNADDVEQEWHGQDRSTPTDETQ
jgi:hypothetical protein